MTCPECGSDKLSVKESRHSGEMIRRRRTCDSCGNGFTTFEKVISRREAKTIDSTEIESYETLSNENILATFREELRNAITAEIIERRKNGQSFATIAKTFNCSRQNVQQYLGHNTEAGF